MDVLNAWYVKQLPAHVVIQMPDLSLMMFPMSPFRDVLKNELTPYKGHYPGDIKSDEVPAYTLPSYGLTKVPFKLDTSVTIRLSSQEKERVITLSKREGLTQSEWIRNHIMPAIRNNNISMEEKPQ
ncbi:MAG: hypothetical protein RBT34_11460 [Anaerolineaceae bacterium]|jgi:hypothetical protein|nr:hypothetical protein [Anaerolineaceae bacterium]